MQPIAVADLGAWKDRVTDLALAIGAIYSLLKFVFAPRLLRVIEERVDARTASALEDLQRLEARMEQVERDHAAADATLRLVGESLTRVTKAMEVVSEQLITHGESLAYIEGTMRSRRPRTSWPESHHEPREGPHEDR